MRKFRKRISLLKTNNNIANELRDLHKRINKELADFQNQYDTDTDFSRNVKAQLTWEALIEIELNKLHHFKSKN